MPISDPTTYPASLAEPEQPVVAPRRRWLTLVTLVLLAAIVVLQRPGPHDPTEDVKARQAATVTAPSMGPFILLGKMLVAFKDQVPNMGTMVRSQLDQPSFGTPAAEDEVRVVMLLIGTGQARAPAGPPSPVFLGGSEQPPRSLPQVLSDVEKDLAPSSPLHEDLKVIRPLLEVALREGTTEKDIQAAVEGLDAAARDGLKSRHGWFAEVLLSAGDDAAPVRLAAQTQALLFAVFALAVGFILFAAFVAGLVLLILGIIRRSTGKLPLAFVAPPRPGTPEPARAAWARGLWLETVAVFLLGFLALKLVQEALHGYFPAASWILWVALLGQWSLIACIFWPVVRGLSWAEWKAGMGWHAPRGVGREVGAGFCAYLAGVPIYFAVAVVVVILMLVTEAVKRLMGLPESPPPTNRITEIIEGGTPLVLLIVFLMATVWAPIVEESIFRGAMHRHLRGRWGFLVAAALTSVAFAVMHGYMLIQLLMIFTLGALFAFMREWRNSIVPSVTAHFVHNSFVMTILLVAGWFMRA